MLGGVRSGKSAFAEGLLRECASVTYVATAEIRDEEMRARVSVHQARRAAAGAWQTREAPLELAAALDGLAGAVLVDSLGMWTTNLLLAERDIDAAVDGLLESLAAAAGPVVLVSDEVGLGGVEVNRLARRFADCHGILNQRIAAQADQVFLVAAGIAMSIKPAGA